MNSLGNIRTAYHLEQFRCLDCGAWLSLGASNDRFPRALAERGIAILLATEPHPVTIDGETL